LGLQTTEVDFCGERDKRGIQPAKFEGRSGVVGQLTISLGSPYVGVGDSSGFGQSRYLLEVHQHV